MLQELNGLESAARTALAEVRDEACLQAVRVQFLGRKGGLTAVLKRLGECTPEERPIVGQRANAVKALLEAEIERVHSTLQAGHLAEALGDRMDVSLPGRAPTPAGYPHPISTTMERIVGIFRCLGFSTYEGPEVETEYHNFEALNMPADHPARDMQDTFYLQPLQSGAAPLLLRTHTSPVQVRVMQSHPPPLRLIAPGAVYRRDADVTHSPMFHQVEGLYVDTDVTFRHLKGMLQLFVEQLFGDAVQTRFRPSFFPFTEPSAEMDLGYLRDANGMRFARAGDAVTGWMEVLGCGMVDPAVFTAVGYDPTQVTGFAFGVGVERIAMLLHGVDDIRFFFDSDLRFLSQFI
ncbi:MAG: phenylalanine--tRNA ligase subunit alpha [Deltaproteobacteria bacterium]|nr:phenylalanine--tRNA ligase subunit alpha [Deltaproteobacteria bacterium]